MTMYWRFTDRARKVMQLANQEAQRLNHARLGTEHVLLGLVKEGAGVGAWVLTSLKTDIGTLRREVEKIVPEHTHEMTLGSLPKADQVRRIVERATQEARQMNHPYVGTEHLLLALAAELDGAAETALHNLGIRVNALRAETLKVLGSQSEPSQCHVLGLARRCGQFVRRHRGSWVMGWSLAGTLLGGLLGREFGDSDTTLTGALIGTLILGAIGATLLED